MLEQIVFTATYEEAAKKLKELKKKEKAEGVKYFLQSTNKQVGEYGKRERLYEISRMGGTVKSKSEWKGGGGAWNWKNNSADSFFEKRKNAWKKKF